MKFLIAISIFMVLSLLLWFMKLGGRVEYGEQGFRGQVHIGWFYITLYPVPELLQKLLNRPQKEKKKKPKKKKKQSPKKPAEKKEEKPKKSVLQRLKKAASQAEDYFSGGDGGELGVVLRAIPDIFAILGETVTRLCVEELTVHYTIPGRHDAAGAAIQYGVVYTTGGAVCTLMDQFVTVKKRSVGAMVDFNEDKAKVWLCVNLSYRMGDLMIIAFHALKEFIKIRNGLQEAKNKQ